MAQTLSEQILSHAAGKTVRAGEVASVAVDLVMMHDSLSPSIIKVLHQELGACGIPKRSRL
jgi:methanogen homoaconitase large subunit